MKTACPLDCYDACSVIYNGKELKGDKGHPLTRGHLCYKLNHYFDYPQSTTARFKGKEITLDEALDILEEKIKESNEILHFRGSGNVGKMQAVTDLFFSAIGATLTEGSLCDAAGQLGIKQGRGKNLILPLEQIQKSELVIVWGRNIGYTNHHILPFLEGKSLVVIDPVRTNLAKNAAMHLQITPRSDLELACILARFVYMQNREDEAFIEKHTQDYSFYVDFIRSYRMVPTTDKIGVDLVDIATLAELMMDMKTVILVGNGVQKYAHGTEVVRAIDSLAAMLGLFGKEGCGVSFLGDTSAGLDDPFAVKAKRVAKPLVDFGAYDLCFIQGSNPAVTMPNSAKVRAGLQESFTVVFGLYEDETAKMADLFIPAKNFLQKNDIRFSYGHEYVELMPKLEENEKALSEYEFTNAMMNRFGLGELKPEQEYIDHFLKQLKKRGEYYLLPSFEEVPYQEGFEEPFCFIDEVEDESDLITNEYHLITPKAKNAINSQFKRDPYLYVPLSSKLHDGDRVEVVSEYGKLEMEVRLLAELRDDCILAYSGSAINYVTPDRADNWGYNAIFQDVKVSIRKVNES
ncbi:molybdopterin-dependent oxidoreductase [Nitratiruptor sp. YY09-18]|uniref:molybdopterin-containing oxidoreductase family protein n=1 Tax=Nitratiruptor sp. YY09-18 TaxID=2724901 RepID=UPI001914E50F|nr:molybdopterin-dependent oxidoreductase [Nitratiruptor sp. YY09-18]BCD68270.1 hypothetical protein NitYY0918_C1181 [Nitratiruptor sp. YY09-18]